MKQKLENKKNDAIKILIVLWDLILQVAKVAGAIALFRLDWSAYGYSVTKILAGVLFAAVVVHYLQTRKD